MIDICCVFFFPQGSDAVVKIEVGVYDVDLGMSLFLNVWSNGSTVV